MALINCPECEKQISNKAISCPNCGAPINSINMVVNTVSTPTTEEISAIPEEMVAFPVLPANLSVGQQITNWKFDAAIKGIYDKRENIIDKIPHGEVDVILHTHGIQISKGLTFYPIHNSQIISLETASLAEVATMNKSVIGRAIVGNLIWGPLGAVVGGMSALGTTKDKYIEKQYIIINYWDIDTKAAQTLLISGKKEQILPFINRQKQETAKNTTENREAQPNTTPAWAIICLIIIVISVIVIIAS